MTLPVQNEAYIFYTALTSQADPSVFQTNPTIAAGDFQVSLDGGVFANLVTLPVVDPAGSFMVKVELSAAEMNGQKVNVVAIDQAGNEWAEMVSTLDVPVGSTETLVNLAFGDRIEDRNSLIVNLRGTSTPVLDKTITGSLLEDGVTITTVDA